MRIRLQPRHHRSRRRPFGRGHLAGDGLLSHGQETTRRDISNAVFEPLAEPEPRIGVLVSLLAAVDKLTVVVIPEQSGLKKKESRQRGQGELRRVLGSRGGEASRRRCPCRGDVCGDSQQLCRCHVLLSGSAALVRRKDHEAGTLDSMSEHSDVMSRDAWWAFEQRLSRFLSAMLDGESVILSDERDDSRYVQFLSFGEGGIRAEVSASASDDEVQRLGWLPPRLNRRGKPVSGIRNLAADMAADQTHRLPAMVVGALRDVWQISDPDAVTAVKVTDLGGPSLADVRLPMRP